MSRLEFSLVAAALISLAEPAVLATLVKVEGSSYRRPGARLLWFKNRYKIGGISGGCLESDLLARCPAVLETGAAELVVYDTTKDDDLLWGTGLGCHGRVHVLLERIEADNPFSRGRSAVSWDAGLAVSVAYQSLDTGRSPGHRAVADKAVGFETPLSASMATVLKDKRNLWTSHEGVSWFIHYVPPVPVLLVFGAGDDARPLVSQAAALGWSVTVLDPRPEMLRPERFPVARVLALATEGDWLGGVSVTPNACAVIMSHHYRFDLPWLRALVSQPVGYVGLLGPRKRGEKLLSALRDEGCALTEAFLERVHSPLGLDLGGDGPEAVALSALAEIQAWLHGRTAVPLRQRKNEPINPRV